MTGEEALQEIRARKDALAKQAQSNLNANYNIYSDYLSKTAQNENKGALNSYQNYPAVEGTDSTRARSAYLNRLASANDAYAEGMRGLNLYRDKLGANMDAASLNADATINGLEYKNALYNDQMAYQRERDAVADAQWQKNFDLGHLSSTGNSGRTGRSYGYYSDPTPPTGVTKFTDDETQAYYKQALEDKDRADRYALSLYGRGANWGQNTPEVEYSMYLYQNKLQNPTFDKQVANAYELNAPNKGKTQSSTAGMSSTAKAILSGAVYGGGGGSGTGRKKNVDMTK